MSKQSPQPSPLLFFDTVNAYQRTAAIQAAIQLDLFSAIGGNGKDARALAEICGASERGTRILCDYLVVIGFLTKEGNRYDLTTDSAAFLDRNSPAYSGDALEFLLSPTLTDGFKALTSSVRKGGTAITEEGTIAPEHPVWVQFARAMTRMTMMPAQLLSKLVDPDSDGKLRVLDIAAGHGMYGIEFARQNPNAEITAVDWPNVLEVARENALAAGVIDRYNTIAGSAFDVDYGDGYDLALLTNFLHHFDPVTCEKLLRKIYESLAVGGRAVTLEFVPNEDRVSPPESAAFSLVMLATTPNGDAYTFSEFDRMFNNAGFSRSELHPLPPSFERVVISYK
jgi:ubiquinone/menaquinone biosynthesis C-methylase UbiE